MKQIYLPFKKIVALIKVLSQKKQTGTLFIVTEYNRSARLVLNNGEVVSIYCFNKFGKEAIDSISTIESGMCRFQKGNIPERRDNLPSTTEILHILIHPSQQTTFNNTKGVAQKTQRRIAPSQKLVLEHCLEEYIGAMAPIICEEHLESNNDLYSTVDSLESVVKQISGPTDARNFKQSVIDQL